MSEREKERELDIDALYRAYGPLVMRRCMQMLKNEEKALDALQDTFVQVLRYSPRLTAASPGALLYRMATNICLNMIRAETRHRTTANTEVIEQIAQVDDSEERVLSRDAIDRVFRSELPSTKDIAVMHYVDGLTHEQIALAVGLSVSGVRKRLRVLKAKLQHKRGEVWQ
jgi:RNA polymerase sigma-70 factor (ECF subfamily)